MSHDEGFPCAIDDLNHEGPCRTPVSPAAAALLRQFGYDTPGPPVVAAESDINHIRVFLEERMGDYFCDKGHGYRLNLQDLAVVVGELMVVAVKRDRRLMADLHKDGA